jgi:hypothetical protein
MKEHETKIPLASVVMIPFTLQARPWQAPLLMGKFDIFHFLHAYLKPFLSSMQQKNRSFHGIHDISKWPEPYRRQDLRGHKTGPEKISRRQERKVNPGKLRIRQISLTGRAPQGTAAGIQLEKGQHGGIKGHGTSRAGDTSKEQRLSKHRAPPVHDLNPIGDGHGVRQQGGQLQDDPRKNIGRIAVTHMEQGLAHPFHNPEDILHRHGDIHLIMGLDLGQIDQQVTVKGLGCHPHRNSTGQPPATDRGKFNNRDIHAPQGTDYPLPLGHRYGPAKGGRITHDHTTALIEEPFRHGRDKPGMGTGQGRHAGRDEIGF